MMLSGGTLLIGAALVLLGFVLISRAREGRHLMGPPSSVQMPPPPTPHLPPVQAAAQTGLSPDSLSAIAAELRGGNKINAIKIYREATGADLKTSKDAVEAMLP